MLPQLATAFNRSTRARLTAQTASLGAARSFSNSSFAARRFANQGFAARSFAARSFGARTAAALGAIAILSIGTFGNPSASFATDSAQSGSVLPFRSDLQFHSDLVSEPNGATEESDWPIDVHARIGQDGLLQVTETFEWDTEQVDPPFLRALPLFVPRTDSMWRKFEYSDFQVNSETAAFEVSILDDSHQLLASITQVIPELEPGSDSAPETPESEEPAETKHEVVFTYQVRGATSVLAPTKEVQNELFWSPLASGGTERATLNFHVSAAEQALSLSCRVLLDDRNMLGWAKALDNAESDPLPDDVPVEDPLCVPNRTKGTVHAAQLNRLSTVIVNATYPLGTVHSDSSIPVEEPDKSPTETDNATTTEFDPTWSENIDFGLDQGSGPIMPVLAAIGAAALLTLLWFLLRTRPDYTFPGISSGDVAAVKSKENALNRADRTSKRRPLEGTIKAPKKLTPAPPSTDLEDLPIELFGALSTLVLSPPQILAMLVSLALRGHIQFERFDAPANNKATSKTHAAWRLTRSESESNISDTESTLMRSIFGENTSIEAHTLHSVFAPQFLEVLALIGNDAQKRGLTVEPVGHAAMASARRTQRTPLGRAYAEQIEGLRAQLLADPSSITVQVIPAIIAMGNESQWVSAAAEVPAPDCNSWLTVPAEDAPSTISDVLALLYSMLSTSESSAQGF